LSESQKARTLSSVSRSGVANVQRSMFNVQREKAAAKVLTSCEIRNTKM